MTTKRGRKRIVTGCLVAMLLPFSARLARSGVPPALTFGGVLGIPSGEAAVRSGSGALELSPLRPVAPWFRETFILFREDGMLPTKSVGGGAASAPETAATPQRTTSAEQMPGKVENLRRTDRH